MNLTDEQAQQHCDCYIFNDCCTKLVKFGSTKDTNTTNTTILWKGGRGTDERLNEEEEE